MAEPKDTTSFFRKVVKFVANPTTEWAEIGTPQDEARETEFAKSELKAMIERKRRNDFVRKREFDMLRKVRREGLSPEQLAAMVADAGAKLLFLDASTADSLPPAPRRIALDGPGYEAWLAPAGGDGCDGGAVLAEEREVGAVAGEGAGGEGVGKLPAHLRRRPAWRGRRRRSPRARRGANARQPARKEFRN